jgi:DNA modification methylase
MRIAKRYELVPLDRIVPYARNARTHSKEQVAQIRASFREFGVITPCLVDESYNLLAGHGRLLAARGEHLSELNCVVVEGLSEAQKRAYILADNRLALNAGWDDEMLSVEIADLKDAAFDISLLGFDERELDSLLSMASDGVEDDGFDVEAELEKPCFSKPGDLWHLGRHRIICGDSTLQDTFNRLMRGTKANLVCIDPPYLVSLESASGKIKNDDLNDAEGYEFILKALERLANNMAMDASIYMFHADSKGLLFRRAFDAAGFHPGATVIWKKDQLVLTRTDFKYIHEPILYGWLKKGKHKWYGDQKQTTIIECPRIKNSKTEGYCHPSSKPAPLIAHLIKLSTQTNGVVLDSFLGSASAMIACDRLERVCYGIELEPKFVDVAVMRYLAAHEGDSSKTYVERDGLKLTTDEVMKDMKT